MPIVSNVCAWLTEGAVGIGNWLWDIAQAITMQG
jgi:hypothetical protein